MNWKERFDKEWEPWIHREGLKAFISTEILEKLIADIREVDKSMQEWTPEEYKANFSSEVCSQLTSKWL